MEDVQLRHSQFLTDEIVEKLEKLTRYCQATNTIAGILSLTPQECLNNLATINALEKKLVDAYTSTNTALGELKTSLLAARKKYDVQENQVNLDVIIPDDENAKSKPQRTPPKPVNVVAKMYKAVEVPSPRPDPEMPRRETARKSTSTSHAIQTRQRAASCSRAENRKPSSADVDKMLKFMAENTPTISIPRCDALVKDDAGQNQILATNPVEVVTTQQKTMGTDIVIIRWDRNGNPIIDDYSTIYSTANVTIPPPSLRVPPSTPTVWSHDFGSYVSPATRGQKPQIFDLRQKLSRPAAGRGRALTVGTSWSDPSNRQTESERWALRTRVDTMVPPESDTTTPYPKSYLSAYGGIPPLYSLSLARHETEWPVHIWIQIPGFEWRGAFIDRHASSSVIGELTIPQGVKRCATLSRLHVDLPWRGRGIPFFIDESVVVPISFEDSKIKLTQSCGVVRALERAVILGQDFVLNNGVYYEYTENQNIRVHIRHTWVPGRRAQRAWQLPDGRGSFQPRKYLNHDNKFGSC